MSYRFIMNAPTVADYDTSDGPPSVLIVSFGESNSGGRIANTDAAAWEIAARPEIQMLNINTSSFESLDIGTNNNLDHFQLTSVEHAWELGLANRVRQQYFAPRSVYYVQTGQGGSVVSQWNVGGSYWNKFLARTNAATSQLSGRTYSVHVWVTLGINDAIAGTADATYKSAMEDIVARIKSHLPGCKVYLATLPPVNATYTTYSTRLTEIAAADSSVVRAVSATSPVTLDMKDPNHWSYRGMKRLAARMVDTTLADLSLPGKGFVWSAREDANWVYFSAINQHANVPTPVNVTVDGYVAAELGAWSSGALVALDSDTTAVNYGPNPATDTYYGAFYSFASDVFSTDSNNGVVGPIDSGVDAPAWARLRWSAANDDLLFETSTNGGTTWTLQRTWAGRLAGVTEAYIKTMTAVGAAYIDIWRS